MVTAVCDCNPIADYEELAVCVGDLHVCVVESCEVWHDAVCCVVGCDYQVYVLLNVFPDDVLQIDCLIVLHCYLPRVSDALLVAILRIHRKYLYLSFDTFLYEFYLRTFLLSFFNETCWRRGKYRGGGFPKLKQRKIPKSFIGEYKSKLCHPLPPSRGKRFPFPEGFPFKGFLRGGIPSYGGTSSLTGI